MSDISGQTTEIVFMSSATLCFAITWAYFWKTRNLPTGTSTTFFLILLLILAIFGIIYYSLNKFAKLDDKIFNWTIFGFSIGFVVIFGGSAGVGLFSNRGGLGAGSAGAQYSDIPS